MFRRCANSYQLPLAPKNLRLLTRGWGVRLRNSVKGSGLGEPRHPARTTSRVRHMSYGVCEGVHGGHAGCVRGFRGGVQAVRVCEKVYESSLSSFSGRHDAIERVHPGPKLPARRPEQGVQARNIVRRGRIEYTCTPINREFNISDTQGCDGVRTYRLVVQLLPIVLGPTWRPSTLPVQTQISTTRVSSRKNSDGHKHRLYSPWFLIPSTRGTFF
jgi:hypothetical protein